MYWFGGFLNFSRTYRKIQIPAFTPLLFGIFCLVGCYQISNIELMKLRGWEFFEAEEGRGIE